MDDLKNKLNDSLFQMRVDLNEIALDVEELKRIEELRNRRDLAWILNELALGLIHGTFFGLIIIVLVKLFA